MIAFRSPRSLYKPAGPCPGELIHTGTLEEEEEEDDDEFCGGDGGGAAAGGLSTVYCRVRLYKRVTKRKREFLFLRKKKLKQLVVYTGGQHTCREDMMKVPREGKGEKDARNSYTQTSRP